MRESIEDAAYHDRLVKVWAELAPQGTDEKDCLERQQDLARICRRIIEGHGVDVAQGVWEVVRIHLFYDQFRADAVARGQQERALAKDARLLLRQARRILRGLVGLHQQARARKWYSVALDADGRRIIGVAGRPWRRYAAFYRRVEKIVDADPLLRFLDGIGPGQGGSPIRKRNKALRDAIRAEGLDEKKLIDTILSAIKFI